MKNKFFIVLFVAQVIPTFAYAATPIEDFIDSATELLANFIPTFLVLAVLVFFWGIVKFITHGGTPLSDERAREDGKKKMVWGMIAIFVIVTLWAIIAFFQTELGLDSGTPLGTLPAQPNAIPVPT